MYGDQVGIGKTGLIELMTSTYQSPDNIITFAATPISITILAERLSGIGLTIEEKQSSLNSNQISTLLYSLAEGRTRLKATKESDLIDNKKYKINVVTTAEEPLNENTHTGASRRTIELYVNKIFSSDEMSRKAHRVSRENYGLALKVFVNYLIKNYSENDYAEIKEKYEYIEKMLYEKCEKNIVNSYIQSISVIVLANILMNEVFGFDFDEESCINLGSDILERLEVEKDIDEVERAKQVIEDWLLLNDKKFNRQSIVKEYHSFDDINTFVENLDNESNENYGLFKDNVYYILPTIFNNVLVQNNFSPNKIRKGFAEKGYINIDEINNRYTVVKFYKGGNRRMIAFKLPNFARVREDELKSEVERNIRPKDIFYNPVESLTIDEDKDFKKLISELEEK